MLTIFTSCKPFRGEDEIAQTNAIRSWTHLKPTPQVIIIGDDFGSKEMAEKYGLQHIPNVRRSEFGHPHIDDLFIKGQEFAEHDICCYINADIVLMSDFMDAIEVTSRLRKPFLMIGRRYDLDVKGLIDFDDRWQSELRQRTAKEGKPFHLPGMDYFVFRKWQWKSMQPFILGNIRWDNWMVFEARRLKIMTIDATDAVTVVHQNHAMKHAEESGSTGIDFDPAAVYNLKLYGNSLTAFFRWDATHVLTTKGIKRAVASPYLRRLLVTVPVFYPKTRRFCNLLRRISSKRRMKSHLILKT